MIKALDPAGNPVLGWQGVRGIDYRCPACHELTTLKQGRIVIEHFAHQPGSACAYGTGESLRHMEMKAQVGKLFRGLSIDYEVCLIPERRADVVVGRFVVECQESAISIEEWDARTAHYNAAGYAILWVWDISRLGVKQAAGKTFSQVLFQLEDGEGWSREVRVPAVVRHCHKHSYGKVYALDSTGSIQSCHIEAGYDRDNEWTGSVWTPKTLKLLSFHKTPQVPRRYKGTDGEDLISLSEGIWWKKAKP